MKKVIVVMCLLFSSCSSNQHLNGIVYPEDEIRIVITKDEHEGRPLFTVIFSDGSALDYMYAEEIAYSLRTGKWTYNEDFKLNK